MWYIIGSNAPTEDESVRVLGVGKMGWVGDDGFKAVSDALVLEDGIDEEAVGVGEHEEGGVEAGRVVEELNAALHGGVEWDLAHGVLDIMSVYARIVLSELA